MAQAPGHVGEARWPMASAVFAAIVLTILLPAAVRVGPKWLLPFIEGVLLVIVIVGDPVRISRRSRELRTVSIVLVSVLVLGTLWSTGQLIDDLIHGGPETNSADELLAAGTVVWLSNIIAFALLGDRRRRGSRPGPPSSGSRGLRLSPAVEPTACPTKLAPSVRGLPVPRVHERDCFQPDRRHAPCAVGEDDDGRTVVHLDRDPRASDRPGRERLYVTATASSPPQARSRRGGSRAPPAARAPRGLARRSRRTWS
jgi:hypothetical protein